MASEMTRRDGTVDFSAGVNSVAVRTLATGNNPGGLKRNESAWLVNATCRDGGISPRWGWKRVGKIADADGLFQGKFVYQPVDGSDPYELWSVSGNILRVDLDTGNVINLSSNFGLTNNPTSPFAYFVQANEFAVIQSGDNSTLPLFWDGATLRRSNGITGVVGGQPGADYTLNFTDWATIAPVGSTFNCPIQVAGPLLGDQGELGVLGTFEVTDATAATFQLRTIASNYVGQKIAPASIEPNYPFTVDPGDLPANINEIPAATVMEYYGGRIWYAIGTVVAAGDISGGDSGTLAYNYYDSVLRVTENPVALAGDGFPLPSQSGTIRAIRYGAAIDAALGQGRLFIFTQKQVYSLQVPVNRDDWIGADNNNQPLLAVVQLVNGSVNDRSVVAVNGDLYYQSLEPGIRSLIQSVRYFSQSGNRQISAAETRILQFNDRSLMRAASGIYFDNRLLQTSLPRETPQGIVHDALIPMDFIPVSTLKEDRPANWEGMYEGVPIFQMSTADFGGRERAFASVLTTDNTIELWEMSIGERMDYAEDSSEDSRRVTFVAETPAFTWADTIGELNLKKLVAGELWVDRLWGTVVFVIEYRPDGTTCWLPWHEWEECSAKNTAETVGLPDGYPVDLGDCYKATMVIPKPNPSRAKCNNCRPANMGYQFQIRLTIKGYCRVRGIWMHAEEVSKGLYVGITC